MEKKKRKTKPDVQQNTQSGSARNNKVIIPNRSVGDTVTNLTLAEARRAVILSEIIGKPLSKRRHRTTAC